MKMRNKGKVHPSPFTSSSSPETDASSLSVLNLLPAALLTILSVLSFQDREVLAYMITRSMKSILEENKKTNKNPIKSSSHNSPSFDCECFECYTIFWFRWDSSPNRELIHQAIEAFEEQNLTYLGGDENNKSKKGKNRKKEKMGRRGIEKRLDFSCLEAGNESLTPSPPPENQETSFPMVVSPGNEPELVTEVGESSQVGPESLATVVEEVREVVAAAEPPVETAAMVVVSGGAHKGFARKVLPDVRGLFNSRLWNLLSPNVY